MITIPTTTTTTTISAAIHQPQWEKEMMRPLYPVPHHPMVNSTPMKPILKMTVQEDALVAMMWWWWYSYRFEMWWW